MTLNIIFKKIGSDKLLSNLYLYICFIVLILYIFGINKDLYSGLILLFFFGLVIIIKIIYYFIDGVRKPRLSDLYLLFPYLLYVVIIPNNYFFKSQDEFAWWGPSIKWMFENDSLVTTDFPEGQRHYPPGQQLFQYYFLKITFWSEANALRAQNIFILSAILFTVSELLKKSCRIPLTFVLASCALYAFQFGYTTIMNDALLGSCFAAAVTAAIKVETNLTSFIKVCLTTFILVLLKDVGIVLAAIVLLMSSCKLLLFKRIRLYSEKNIWRIAIFLSALVIGLIILRASWQSYVLSINSVTSLKHLELHEIINGNWPRNFALVSAEFIRRVWSGIFLDLKIFKINIFFTTIIFTFYSLLIIFKAPRRRYFENILIFMIYFLGLVTFISLHLYLYIVWFGDYEGPRLSSFERYIGIYYLCWLILLIPITVQQFIQVNNTWLTKNERLASTLILIISCAGSVALHVKYIFAPISQIAMRQEIEASTHSIKKYISTGQKVYFIQQNSLGFEQSLFSYLMRPFNARNWCWSIGEKYYPSDVWTCNEELKKLIFDYDYLYIYRADQQFWNNSKDLFDVSEIGKKSGIYRILKHNNSVTLINVTSL